MEPKNESRLYPICGFNDEILAGVSSDKRQVLAVEIVGGAGVVLFDADGHKLDESFVPPPEGAGSISEHGGLPPWMSAVTSRFGLRPTAIHVRWFESPAFGLGIRARPEEYAVFLDNPEREEPDPELRKYFFEKMAEWDRVGRYVLLTWGKEYWMDFDGLVYAS